MAVRSLIQDMQIRHLDFGDQFLFNGKHYERMGSNYVSRCWEIGTRNYIDLPPDARVDVLFHPLTQCSCCIGSEQIKEG
jgi:hypothetical protein